MDITWEHVLATAKAESDRLEQFSQFERELVIDHVNLMVSDNDYQSEAYALEVRRYLAAHIAVLAVTRAAGEGSLGSESIGGVSRSLTMAVNNPTAQENTLSTQYGRMYWELIGANFGGVACG
jgi:hypothetical protein